MLSHKVIVNQTALTNAEPTPTPTASSPTTHTVTLTQSADGSIRNNGQYLQYPNVGDLDDNRDAQGFVQFVISGIRVG